MDLCFVSPVKLKVNNHFTFLILLLPNYSKSEDLQTKIMPNACFVLALINNSMGHKM